MMIFAAVSFLSVAAHAEDAPADDVGPLLMHRHRLSVAPETFFFLSNGRHESFAAMGLGVSYYLGDRWALKVSGDWLATTGSPPYEIDPEVSSEAPSALATALVGTKVEFDAARARGSLAQNNGGAFDFFVSMGPGAIWTRPASQIDPSHRSFTYSPRLEFEVDVGTRAFVSRSFAVSLEVGNLTYDQPEENSMVASTPEGRFDSATWYGDAHLRTGLLTRLTIAFLAPGPAAAR